MADFVISDTHFSHKNIIAFCNRPYVDIHHMNQALVENWNSVVYPEDTVYHLGDVSFGGLHWSDIFPKLNGRKVVILGNHDSKGKYHGMDLEVHDHYVYKRLIGDKEIKILMYHYPVFRAGKEDYQGRRFIIPPDVVELYNNCDYHLYGHVHNVVPADEPANAMCVSVENIGYKPMLLPHSILRILYNTKYDNKKEVSK